jgi:exosome complex exonuclease DIS3/RRP44
MQAAGSCLFMAADKKIPKIRIESKNIEKLMDRRILVCIDSWPLHSR